MTCGLGPGNGTCNSELLSHFDQGQCPFYLYRPCPSYPVSLGLSILAIWIVPARLVLMANSSQCMVIAEQDEADREFIPQTLVSPKIRKYCGYLKDIWISHNPTPAASFINFPSYPLHNGCRYCLSQPTPILVYASPSPRGAVALYDQNPRARSKAQFRVPNRQRGDITTRP